LTIHWRGGDHTRLEVKKNKTGRNRWVTDADVADLVQVLARQMPDHAIAAVQIDRSGQQLDSVPCLLVAKQERNCGLPRRRTQRARRGDAPRGCRRVGGQHLNGSANDPCRHASVTQHSLPSGRYSLLGPDFHRLDRTSFSWRTYSITSSAGASSGGGTFELLKAA
jgi:hypothetical protein